MCAGVIVAVVVIYNLAMDVSKLNAIEGTNVNVIIETPKGCRNKYHYEHDLDVFRLKKTLPIGFAFPFDFGFVPNTQAEDGDPLDVIVIADEPAYPGCLVQCRIIGAIAAEQKEKDGHKGRNDRIVAIPVSSREYGNLKTVNDLGEGVQRQIELFFAGYNEQEGKVFTPLEWVGADEAMELVKQSIK